MRFRALLVVLSAFVALLIFNSNNTGMSSYNSNNRDHTGRVPANGGCFQAGCHTGSTRNLSALSYFGTDVVHLVQMYDSRYSNISNYDYINIPWTDDHITGYRPGVTYNMVFGIMRDSLGAYNMQITAATSSGSSSIGTIIAGGSKERIYQFPNGFDYAELQQADTSFTGGYDWGWYWGYARFFDWSVLEIDWTPASSMTEDIIFYTNGVAGNGDGTAANDYELAPDSIIIPRGIWIDSVVVNNPCSNDSSNIEAYYNFGPYAHTDYEWEISAQGLFGQSNPAILNLNSGSYSMEWHGIASRNSGAVAAVSSPATYANAGFYRIISNASNFGSSWDEIVHIPAHERTYSITIYDPPGVSNSVITPATCGLSDGAIQIDTICLNPPCQYSWRHGASTPSVSGIPMGNYELIITCAQGCSDTFNYDVPGVLSLSYTDSIQNESCPGNNDGRIELSSISGGTPPYTYNWSNGSDSTIAIGLSVGSVSVTITDSVGCVFSDTFSIVVDSPAAIPSVLPTAGCGLDTGSISLTILNATPPYSFNWNTGDTIQNLTGLDYGWYVVTVTDSNGCVFTASDSVIALNGYEIDLTATDPSCNGSLDGWAQATVLGDTVNYSFAWSSGGNQATEFGLGAATYSVTATDTVACIQTDSITLSEPAAIALSATPTSSACDTAIGSINLSSTGGTPPYTYNWSTGDTTEDLSNLWPGTYCVTVTDAQLCWDSICVVVGNIGGQIPVSVSYTICPGDTAWQNGLAFTSGGLYYDTISAGCDTIYEISINEIVVYIDSQSSSICYGDTQNFRAMQLTSSGTYFDTVGPNGCDTVYQMNLLVNPLDTANLFIGLCQGDTFDMFGNPYSAAGSWTDTGTNQHGCDSIINLTIGIDTIVQFSQSLVICPGDSFIVGANVYNSSNTYIDTLLSFNGCDSLVTTNLTVKSIIPEVLEDTICFGASSSVFSSNYSATGTYWDTLLGGDFDGCDTIVNLNLFVRTQNVVNLTDTICLGDSFHVFSSSYATTGLYSDTLIGGDQFGCDTIVNLDLTVGGSNITSLIDTICQGESVAIFGNIHSTTAVYSDTLPSGAWFGCDSIVQLNLTVLPVFRDTIVVNHCREDSLFLPNATFYVTGDFNFVDTVGNTLGCPDSIILYQMQTYDSLPHLNISIQNASCGGSDGSINLSVDSSSAYLVSWNTGDTGLNLTNLAIGGYAITVTDQFTGCAVIDSVSVGDQGAPVITATTTNAACAAPSGSITTSVSSGIQPYSYSWSTGNTSANLTNVLSGWYSVTVTDSLGCRRHQNFYVGKPANCLVYIGGKVVWDQNVNCSQDGGEIGLQGVRVDLNNGASYYTDLAGTYYFEVPAGNYTISQNLQSNQAVVCPAANSIVVNLPNGGDSSMLNIFYDTLTISPDLSLSMTCGVARPGFSHWVNAYIYNPSSQTVPAIVSLNYDAKFYFDSWYATGLQPPSLIDTINHNLVWNTTIGPNQTSTFRVRSKVPPLPIAQPGWTFAGSAAVSSSLDLNPSNNTNNCNGIVTGAYDPNDKQVTPGTGPDGEIDIKDGIQTLKYKVRFQNTGTDTAFNVTILDTLDILLDPSTINILGASHPYIATIDEYNILKFDFPDIYLPDSNVDYEGSNGFIQFEMDMDDNLPVGTQFSNRAAIYFDHNPPIITNDAWTTIVQKVGIKPLDKLVHNIFPNPANEKVIIEGSGALGRIRFYDLQGRLVIEQQVDDYKTELSIDHLEPGNYMIVIAREKMVNCYQLSIMR